MRATTRVSTPQTTPQTIRVTARGTSGATPRVTSRGTVRVTSRASKQAPSRVDAFCARRYGMFMIALISGLWLLAGVALANTGNADTANANTGNANTGNANTVNTANNTATDTDTETDRAKIETFLTTTGFDVALESIKLSAESAPLMLGLDKDEFGGQWVRLSGDVFDTELMQDMALDILEQTLTPELLNHANDFYASDLGQRLVQAENASHMTQDEERKSEAGEAIVSGLVQHGADRLTTLKRMNAAVDAATSSVRAIQEIQVRFLMAAAGAGVIELGLDEPDLRAMMSAQAPELRRSIMLSALSGSAYTYQAFSDDEVETYAAALEHPKMKQVYALMGAVQYEVMANRFEALAAEMAKLQPSTDL